MRIFGINNAINFQRRPTKEEEPDLKAAIDKAYNIMGTEERAVITHGSCFPAYGRDTYIGSPYGKAAKEYTKFLMLYGFNGAQLGPSGELQKGFNSPYNSSAFAKNRLFIDLEELTTEKYGKILSKETFENVTRFPSVSDKNYDKTDFAQAEHTYNIALRESYKKFRSNLINGQPQAIALSAEYVNFKNKHGMRLNDEAVFKILSRQYGTEDFAKWNNKLDENLISEYEKGNKEAFERYKNLSVENSFEVEQYKFEQFIATKQIKENKEWRDNIGFKYINDLLVGCSKMDEWRCKEAFLEGYQLGAKEYKKNPQMWRIPVLNPRKLFEGDDLGPAGKFLRDKIDFALEFCENIRVDHAMGLIEPYVIENKSIIYDKNGKILNTPEENPVNSSYMSELYTSDGEKVDDYKNYSSDYRHADGQITYFSKIMDKIVMPAFKKHNLDKNLIVWEDLCSRPYIFNKVYYDNLKLPGLNQLEWSKAENSPETYWNFVGSHDSIPAQQMVKRDYIKNSDAWNPLYLAGYLNQDPKRAHERNAYCDKIANDDRELVFAKFSELLTTKKFQISFADLFGITDTVYNIAGTDNEENWKERLTADYLDKYYENLSSENPTALNIPEILKQALQAKIDMKIKDLDADERRELYAEYKPVLDKLQHYAEVLKEPEN